MDRENYMLGSVEMVHYHRSWQSGGSALIIVGLVFLGILVISLKQYIVDRDYIGILILSVLSFGCILAGIAVKRYARKSGKE